MVIVFCFKKTSRVAVYVILKMKKILIMMQHFKVWSVQFIYFPFVNKVCEGRNICMKGRPQEFATIYISGVSFKFPPRLIDCPPLWKEVFITWKNIRKICRRLQKLSNIHLSLETFETVLGSFFVSTDRKGIFFYIKTYDIT